MSANLVRPMRPGDWVPVPIEPGRYSNPAPLTGYARRDGRAGTPLHPVCGDEGFEEMLSGTFARLRAAYSGVNVARRVVKMPYWAGESLPTVSDYALVEAPESLTTTSITVVLVPARKVVDASMSFCFRCDTLPSLRQRMADVRFHGLAGNLGYYMTRTLIENKFSWSHNVRYPAFPLPGSIRSYLGFHLFRDRATGEAYGSFRGAHPAAVGIREDGEIEIVPGLHIPEYRVRIGEHEMVVDAIDDPGATGSDVVVFTPALRTPEIERHIAAAEASAGTANEWETYAPMVPIADADQRIHVFVASEGDGRVPVEKVVAVWEGEAPLPSFGAVLSVKGAHFRALFGGVEAFKSAFLGRPVQIIPSGALDYVQLLGGLIPAVIDGQHVYCVETVHQVMESLTHYANATSPIGQAGRETRNFDLYVREPGGVLIRTGDHVGWVLFDGRHELSLGVSVVDAALLLSKLEGEGTFGGRIQQAAFIDGGSAMKVYWIESDGTQVTLEPLNRIAAGSRNKPGADYDGYNLYTLLKLGL